MFDTDEKLHENFIFNLKKTIKRKTKIFSSGSHSA